jgi:tRNA modification GTPase
VISRNPHSYTGEDTVEFFCHGSPIVLSEVLRTLFAYGVRQALPGEFTKRAFMNGKMDLTQAEAVIDLIEAETPIAALNAAGQLHGAISKKLNAVYSALVDIIAHFHAVLDYPDEDIDDFKLQDYKDTLEKSKIELNRLIASYERGRFLHAGIRAAIIGRPNTGKSSLLNMLLGYDRAIVTDIPGTTRDTIEEKVLVGNVILRLIDTAGLRDTGEVIEKMGVERTLSAIKTAQLILLVLDSSEISHENELDIFREIPANIPKIILQNKIDLPLNPEFRVPDSGLINTSVVRISALTGDGLDDLEAEIKRLFPEPESGSIGEIITNTRQFESIFRARFSIGEALKAMSLSTPDAILTEVEAALAAIGEVIGKTHREDIISRIFERFCVGK